MSLQLTTTQYLFRHNNSNGHADFYKVTFVNIASVQAGTWNIVICKNGVTFNTGFFTGIPTEQAAQAQLISTFINTDLFN